MSEKQPETLSVSVGENIRSGEAMGHFKSLFQNPTNDPKIVGATKVRNIESLNRLGPIAFAASKEAGKPVIIIVEGFTNG